ncbi:hypothetical protein [Nocardia nepalensis]|uniref:hypothetical protein n=1 Tax=Nocardia nepalensis TaxID=3375448 RepID=UPI003B6724D6
MILEILTGIGAFVLILQSATQVPVAVAALVRACGTVFDAVRELRDTTTRPASHPHNESDKHYSGDGR